MTLRIDTIKLENYRQYKDATIEFSRDPKRMLTVLRGNNGVGKTNIMNAITWCLYGKENHLGPNQDNRDQISLPVINKEVLRKTPKQKIINMRVELVLVGKSDIKIRIERILTLYSSDKTGVQYDKDVGAPIPIGSTPDVKARYHWYDPNGGGWDTVEGTDFDIEIRELLPPYLSRYFLFDGEQLEDFFHNDDNVKNGIENVSQIGVVQEAINRLRNIEKEKIRNSKKIDPQVKSHYERLSNIREESNRVEAKIKELELEKKRKRDQLNRIDERLRDFDHVKNYINEEKVVQIAVDELKKRYREKNAEIKKLVLEYAGYTQAHTAITKTLHIIEEKSDAGVLPPNMRDTFLNELLESNRCICGHDISGGPARDLVMEQLGNAKYTPIQELCNELKFRLKSVKISDIQTKLRVLEEEEDRLDDEIGKKESKLKQLNGMIRNVGKDDDNTKELAEKRSVLKTKIRKLNDELAVSRHEKERKDDELKKYKQKYLSAIEKANQRDDIIKEVNFCSKSLSSLKAAQEKLITDVRTKVEKNTEEFFLNSIWKKNSYSNVKINEEYKVTAVDMDGSEVRDSLSSGERMILAFAFMAALRKVTNLEFPLIIDTPLGRISGETRYKLANVLPTSLQGDQVVLLVTDSEYQAEIRDDYGEQKFPAVRDIIARHVGKDFDIKFDGGSSEVKSRE